MSELATPNPQSSHQEHLRIAGSVPESEILTPPTPRNLGSFIINRINTGDYVPLGSQHAVEADFDRIEAINNPDLVGDYSEYVQELETNSDNIKLTEALASLENSDKEVFLAAIFASNLAAEFFADELVDAETRAKVGWRPVDADREDTYHIKKLSETSDDGLCAEYSLVVGEIMSRIGVDTSYTVAFRQEWADEDGEYHAMLTTEDGLLIDPLLIAQTRGSTKPMGMLKAEPGNSLLEQPKGIAGYTDIFERTGTYSASPIPAMEQIGQNAA